MRALVLLIAGLALGAETPRARIYIVTRAANVEARAVLSGRLVGMNASSLQWIENSGVVRAELPQDAVDRVKSDKDVVLVLNSEEPATAESAAVVPLVSPTAGVPGKMIMPVPGMDTPGMGMPMGGIGMGAMGLGAMGTGMPMGGLTNMIDLAVGSLARKLVTRPPSCRITVKNAPVNFGAAARGERKVGCQQRDDGFIDVVVQRAGELGPEERLKAEGAEQVAVFSSGHQLIMGGHIPEPQQLSACVTTSDARPLIARPPFPATIEMAPERTLRAPGFTV